MVFNSVSFALFLFIVFVLYWYVFKKNAKTQNILLLMASIVFYSLADLKFISLLAISGLVNFYLARYISTKEEGNKRRNIFYLGIVFNVGILLYFKYFNFFIDSFVTLFNYGGAGIEFTPFHILLPLGISFFTFQMVGYLIDVNNEEIEPTNDLLGFFTYLAYFPKILSGPIERVQRFLPQIEKKRVFDYNLATDGMRQILWGLFKKNVIADNLFGITNAIFNDYLNLNGSTLLIGAILLIIWIYTDFSGYSDIACGVSKLFGIRITNNFAYPFFSTNISDFWKKWHISLTSWMLDYIYTPLSFILRRYKKKGLIISIILTFLLVGLWHGDNLTYIVFGVLNGLYFIPIIYKGKPQGSSIVAEGKILPTIKESLNMLALFLLVSITSVFFGANTIEQAFGYIKGIFSLSFFTIPKGADFIGMGIHPLTLIILISVFFCIEWLGRNFEYAIADIVVVKNKYVRWTMYSILIFIIGMYMNTTESPFMYLKF